MTFMDGYDESSLAAPSGDPRVFSCLLPSSLMEQHGIRLGDTVRVAINQVISNPDGPGDIFRHFDLLVIGRYEKQGAEDTIYAPLPIFFETRLIWDDVAELGVIARQNVSCVSKKLKGQQPTPWTYDTYDIKNWYLES